MNAARNILVIDDDRKRDVLLRTGFAWAERVGGSVKIFGAVNESLVRDTTRAIGAVGRVASAISEDFLKEKREHIITALRKMGAPETTDIITKVGSPLEELKKTVDETQPFMIVIPAEMKSGMLNISEEVAGYTSGNCFCPVGAFDSLRFNKIIMISSGDLEKDRPPLQTALSIARENSGTLLILRILDFNNEMYVNAPDLVEKAHAESRTIMDDEVTYAKNEGIEADGLIREGQVPDVLDKLSAEAKADLIILGGHGRTGLNRMLMGSIEGRISKKVKCPLLIVKKSFDF